jgi:hypothetical protein
LHERKNYLVRNSVRGPFQDPPGDDKTARQKGGGSEAILNLSYLTECPYQLKLYSGFRVRSEAGDKFLIPTIKTNNQKGDDHENKTDNR